jgi:hypothetical protein
MEFRKTDGNCGTGTRSCPVAGFDINSVEHLSSAVSLLVLSCCGR